LKITAQFSIVMAAIFAAICFGVAITGFNSLAGITDPAQLGDAKGFAWFWAFLGSVAVVFGAVGIWIVRTEKDGEDA
jgi:hypothetical protein